MKEILRFDEATSQEKAETVQEQGLDYVRTQGIFRSLKKEVSNNERVPLQVNDLLALDIAFRNNPNYAEDAAWVREELFKKFDSAGRETKLRILGELADAEPELVRVKLEQLEESLKPDIEKLKNSERHQRDENQRNARNSLNAIGEQIHAVTNKIGGADYSFEYDKRVGYESALDTALETKNEKTHETKLVEVRISHLVSPELGELTPENAPEQWQKMMAYFKEVSKPAETLTRWYGSGIDARRRFLTKQLNIAIPRAIDIINHLSATGGDAAYVQLSNFITLIENAAEKLEQTSNEWGSRREEYSLMVPFENIQNPKILNDLAVSRKKIPRPSKKVETPEARREREREPIPIKTEIIETQLGIVAADKDVPELAEQQSAHAFRILEQANKSLNQCSPIDDWSKKSQGGGWIFAYSEGPHIQQFDAYYESIKRAAARDEKYRPLLAHIQEQYKPVLMNAIERANKSSAIVNERIGEVVDPRQNWDEAYQVLSTINKTNKVRVPAAKGDSNYRELVILDTPELVKNSVLALSGISDEEKAKRIGQLLSLFATKDNPVAARLNQELAAQGFESEAALCAAKSNDTEFITQCVIQNKPELVGIVLNQGEWDFGVVKAALLSRMEQDPQSSQASLEFLTSYLKKENVPNRSEMVVSTLERLSKLQERFAGQPQEELLKQTIKNGREVMWELWQQGAFQRNESKMKALKIIIEDGRDLTVASMVLSPAQQVEVLYATSDIAVEKGNINDLRATLDKIKKFPTYERDNSVQQKYERYAKELNSLVRKQQSAELTPEQILQMANSLDTYERGSLVRDLIDAKRYHEVVTLFGSSLSGEQGQKMIVESLRDGKIDFATELIDILPNDKIPDKNLLYAFTFYAQYGGDLSLLDKAPKAINRSELGGEVIKKMQAAGAESAKVLDFVNLSFQGTDTLNQIRKYIQVCGFEAFTKLENPCDSDTLQRGVITGLLSQQHVDQAERYVVTQKNEALTLEYISNTLQRKNINEALRLANNIQSLEGITSLTDILITGGYKDEARKLADSFINAHGSTMLDAPRLPGYSERYIDFDSEKAKQRIEEVKRLAHITSPLNLINYIDKNFRNAKNFEKLSEILWDAMSEAEFESKDLVEVLRSEHASQFVNKYTAAAVSHKSKRNFEVLITAMESIMSRDEAIGKYPSVYASYVALNARQELVAEIKQLPSAEKVQKLLDIYSQDKSTESVLLASSTLDQSEWGRYLQLVPASERDRVLMLSDWHRAQFAYENRDLGPITERASSRITEAIANSDQELLRSSLETLLGLRTPDAASRLTKIFLNHLESGGEAGVTYQLCSTLSKMESFKANTVLSELVAAENTPDILARYIIRLLVENHHFDENLRTYFEDKRQEDKKASAEGGESVKKAVGTFRKLVSELGINPDSAIMRYVEQRSDTEIQGSIAEISKKAEEYTDLGAYDQAAEWLLEDVNTRLLYFLKFGGRTNFSLINDYNFGKFTHLLKLGHELEVHDQPLRPLKLALEGQLGASQANQVMERIKDGQFPIPLENGREATWDFTVDANKESQVEQARLLAGSSLGQHELGALSKAITYGKYLEKAETNDRVEVAKNLWKEAGKDFASLTNFVEYCEANLGDDLRDAEQPAILSKATSPELPLDQSRQFEVIDVPVTKFEEGLVKLGRKLMNDVRQSFKQNKITKEERDRLLQIYENPENVLPEMLRGELPDTFSGVLEEWKSHLQEAVRATREAKALKRGESQVRDLRLRFLDKTASMPEYLRFADSAQCCFTSKGFGEGVGAQEYVSRIWKDPMSFVFHIEEPNEEQSDKRTSVGFVFGSYGINRENEPVVILNGVYMDRKTNLAARKVVEVIEREFAKPLGCKEELIASQHAGSSNYGAEFANTDREYLRLRALKQKYNDDPEQHTYDDIGLVAVDAKEGRIQDTQVVNRWAKTRSHIYRKEIK